MDPYLERRWGDFHATFVTYLRDAVNPGLPGGLRARVEERVLVEGGDVDSEGVRGYRPDVHVFEREPSYGFTPGTEGGGVATLEPPTAAVDEPVVLLDGAGEGLTQRSLVIVDAATGGRVVSAIELLSPTNKRSGAGQAEYLDKQEEYLQAGVNLLELDLLLGGSPTTLAARRGVPEEHRSLYHASLLNFRLRSRLELYPIRLDGPLPRIALPLRAGDAAVAVDLQGVMETTYERGYYEEDTRYDEALDALPPGERAWAAERIERWRAGEDRGASGAAISK